MRLAWGSWWDRGCRAPLRIGLAAIMGIEQLVEAHQVDWQSRDPTRYPPTGALSQTLATIPGAAWMLWIAIAVGLVALARDRRPIAGGLFAITAAAVLSEWQTQIFGSPSRNAFFPGAVVLGWILGQAWARTLAQRAGTPATRDDRERLGEVGALACLAAAYVGSCISKLSTAGIAWADGTSVQALVLWQQPVAQWSWLLAWREAILDDGTLAAASSIATLVIEGGAFLLLFGPRLRLAWAAALVGLHIVITLLCTMPYVEPMALLVLLAPPWSRLRAPVQRQDPSAAAVPRRGWLPPRMAALLVGVVALAWLVSPWGWTGVHIDLHPSYRDDAMPARP